MILNGFTQEDLANRINVSRQTISNWENGKTLPDIQSISLLSSLYDEDVVTGLSGGDSPSEQQQSVTKVDEVGEEHIDIFAVFLDFVSLFIPLVAILSLFIIISYKGKIKNNLYKISVIYLTSLSLVNVAIIITATWYLYLNA